MPHLAAAGRGGIWEHRDERVLHVEQDGVRHRARAQRLPLAGFGVVPESCAKRGWRRRTRSVASSETLLERPAGGLRTTQEADDLDVSVLSASLTRYADGRDQRLVGTIDAVRRELTV